MTVTFQRRVRRWLSNNALALTCYEDHRLYLHSQRTRHEMSALILWFERRERQLQQSTKGVRKTSSNPNPNPNPNPLTLTLTL